MAIEWNGLQRILDPFYKGAIFEDITWFVPLMTLGYEGWQPSQGLGKK